MNNIWILAQTDAEQAPSGISSEPLTTEGETTTTTTTDSMGTDPNSMNTQQKRSPMGGYGNLIFLGLMFAMMYVVLFRGPRKKQQQHKQMVQSLEKGDKIQTIGGIIGTIVDVKDNEITLKIDESNNTKIKILRSAIGKNLSKE